MGCRLRTSPVPSLSDPVHTPAHNTPFSTPRPPRFTLPSHPLSPSLKTRVQTAGESGECECQFGFGGPDCSQRLLPACHLAPEVKGSIPAFGHWMPKNCLWCVEGSECMSGMGGLDERLNVVRILFRWGVGEEGERRAGREADAQELFVVRRCDLWVGWVVC